MLSIAQIYAILSLLSAFNVPVDTVSRVEGILMATQTPSAVIAPSSPQIGGIGTEVPRETAPMVDVRVNGSKSPVYILKTGCIQLGVKTCGYGVVEWKSRGVTACGGGGTPNIGWAGNHGTSGGMQGEFTATTTVLMRCGLPDGTLIEDSVEVLLK